MDRVRLKDIAESVGCSIAVVSHVLNHSTGNISCRPDLRERILRRAGELHYAPHYASRALRFRRIIRCRISGNRMWTCSVPRRG